MNAADTHWRQFTEFCEYELATGGPDPHARYVGILAFPHSWKEIVWRGGLYSAVYTAPTAEALWRAWPYERVGRESQGVLLDWLREHWAGLPLRRERRAVRTPEKLARCLWSYHQWMEYQLGPVMAHMALDPYVAYEEMWRAADRGLYGFGRYALTKLLDYYERYCDVGISMPDIRPVDGWSPRETLQLLSDAVPDAHSNHPAHIQATNQYAVKAKQRLEREVLDTRIDWFRFEVLLCEYRQSCERERQYPGRSIDSELKYLRAVEGYWLGRVDRERTWDQPSFIWDVRKHIHPRECLGEQNGWDGTRDELGAFLNGSGQTWSDLLWDYSRYREGPVKEKEGGRERIRNLARQTLGESADKQPVHTAQG